jgi:hypothetical protein
VSGVDGVLGVLLTTAGVALILWERWWLRRLLARAAQLDAQITSLRAQLDQEQAALRDREQGGPR